MGRPPLGRRVQMNVRIDPDILEQIDAARGQATRDSWVAKACMLALRPAARLVEPEVHQPIHTCKFQTLIGTRYAEGKKYRMRRCSCGKTQEEAA